MKYLLCNVCIVLRKMMRTMPIGDRAVTTTYDVCQNTNMAQG